MTDAAEKLTYCFTVFGEPKAQPRARAVKRGAHARVYDPGTADNWKNLVAIEAKKHLPPAPLEGPLSVSIWFYLPRPKRLMRKSDPDGSFPHTGKPDRDNLDKAVLDTLTAIGFWRDDCQVCGGFIAKEYAAKNQRPGAHITITELECER